LSEVPIFGSKYTWWNGHIEEGCILKRLDRILVNNEFLAIFPSTEVHHFIRQGTDHSPLHVVCKTEEEPTIKPFRFLNFWTKHQHFTKIVCQNWNTDFVGSPFMEIQSKLKRVKRALGMWSKEVFGNIFQQIATLEDMIRIKENQFEINPSAGNRTDLSRMEAELKKYLKIEEEYWKIKAGMRWYVDRDRNTKFFHPYVKGRRKKLHMSQITNEIGEVFQTNHQMGEATLAFF